MPPINHDPDERQNGLGRLTAEARNLARSPRQIFMLGFVHAAPMLIVIVPFAMLFGVVGDEAGLSLAQIMGFSTLVLAGASQFTAVQLMTDQAPVILVIVSGLAVNLRMAMYSASLVPWIGGASLRDRALISYLLVDHIFVLGMDFAETNPRTTLSQKLAYFYGLAVPICSLWVFCTWLGAQVGSVISETIPLDFALPITFLAMIAPMLRTRAHVMAATVSVAIALALAWLPSGLGMLIAAPIGMAVGAWVEIRDETVGPR